ncbi:MAG: hypothetical protein FWG50_09945 [Kiritimatiellaeota bacterium]|nr:hypothetical protein [Kiritimatiellota bacterium]
MAAAVDSNVVGYNTVGVLTDDMTMIGINFDEVGGGGLPIQKALTGDFNGGASFGLADNLMVWTPSGYKFFYYGVWNDPLNPEWDNLWYDNSTGDEAAYILQPGDALWYVRRGAATSVSVAGEVLATGGSVSILADDMTMFSNTHPVPVPLNGSGGLNVQNPTGGASFGLADNLMIWTPSGYKFYYYGVWNDSANPEWDNLWYDNATGDEASISLEVGQAAWYVRKGGATTITFSSPL